MTPPSAHTGKRQRTRQTLSRALAAGLLFCIGHTSGCAWVIKGVSPQPKFETQLSPEPPAPSPRTVELPFLPTPDPDEGLVIVDVRGPPASVHQVGNRASLGAFGVAAETRLLCANTPCAFVLPYGGASVQLATPGHENWDAAVDPFYLDVLPNKPQLITHVMSRSRSEELQQGRPPSGVVTDLILETLGWSALLTSIIIISSGPEEQQSPAWVAGVGGAALIGLGVVLYDPGTGSHTVRHRVPNATTLSPFPAP